MREYLTLRRAARDYHEREIEPKLTRKRAAQWITSLETRMPAKLLDAPIESIEAGALLDALRPIYRAVPETGRRIRQRLDALFDDAVMRKFVLGNPTRTMSAPTRDRGIRIKRPWSKPYAVRGESLRLMRSGARCAQGRRRDTDTVAAWALNRNVNPEPFADAVHPCGPTRGRCRASSIFATGS
jgi:integrase-like protein